MLHTGWMKLLPCTLLAAAVALPLHGLSLNTPTLSVNNFNAGDFAIFEVVEATPHSPVMFAMSFRGGGPTNTQDYGIVYLSKPFHMMPTIVSDALGVAINELKIPRAFQGRHFWFLAYDVATATFTNTVEAVVQ